MTMPYEPATDGAVDPDADMVDEPTTSLATAPAPADEVEPDAPAEPELDVEYDPVAEALRAIAADAKSRGWRTLFQGAVAASASAAGLVVLTYVRTGDLGHLDYKALASAAAVAAGGGLVSYLHNLIGNKR